LEAANPGGLFQLSGLDSADGLRQVLDETFNVTPPAPVLSRAGLHKVGAWSAPILLFRSHTPLMPDLYLRRSIEPLIAFVLNAGMR
jgi:hypothetical protein